MDVAGIPFENNTDGLSVLPTLLGDKQQLHDYLYWDYGHVRDEFIQSARWENWKGIKFNETGKIEIFNLENDPGEEINIAMDRSDLVKEFKEILLEAYTPSNDYPVVIK